MANKPSWTKNQQKAIETIGKTLLVSAAAGSGKTATLTERIIRSLTRKKNPADLSRMLIVTFTRASASDLKAKISRALADALAEDPSNQHLASQITLLESAKICTIDSFYYDILKNNFQKLSLPGNLRLIDDAELQILYRTVMDDVLEEFYEKEPDFEDFLDHFEGIKSARDPGKPFLSIYEILLSYRAGLEILTHCGQQLKENINVEFFKTPYGSRAHTETVKTLEYVVKAMTIAEEYFEADEKLSKVYLSSIRGILLSASKALRQVNEYDFNGARETLLAYSLPPLEGRGASCDEYGNQMKVLRTESDELLSSLRDDVFCYSQEQISVQTATTADLCEKTYRFLSAFDQKLQKEKLQRGICYFSDIRRFVMQLIVDEKGDPTPLAQGMREQFDEIYIDEYQDTDEVQDLIFRTIAKPNNRFMVGDIKQSIYSFRGAEPSIFANYKRTMPKLGSSNSPAQSIFMSNNFRCDENVVLFSNLVSSYLFRNCGQSIQYTTDDDLKFSKEKPYKEYNSPKVVIAITGVKKDKKEKVPKNAEDLYILNEIKRLLAFERKADGSPIRPGDIAILMRQKTNMATLMDLLLRNGIPACSAEEHNFFENPDVLLVLSLLSTIDNPQRDVALAGTLCSPFYEFSLDDLVILKKSASEELSLFDSVESYTQDHKDPLASKCIRFLESLDYWRDRARSLPVDRLIRELYRDFAILSMQEASEVNLLRFYEYARGFESGGFRGLYGFVRYIDQIIDSGTKIKNEGSNAGIDAVQLLTIHSSKGLEFPVCFLYETAKPFSSQSKRERLQFSPDVGIGFRLHDESGLGYYDTPIRRTIINHKTVLDREEDMRILYVAMTRARERLYVTAQTSSFDEKQVKARNTVQFGKAFGILRASCYLDWILAAIEDADGERANSHFLSILPVYNDDPKEEENEEEMTAKEAENAERLEESEAPLPIDTDLAALLRARFSFAYPYEHVSDLPAKLSVSKLHPAVLDEEDNAKDLSQLDDEAYDQLFADAFRLPLDLSTERQITAADRGTATHNFLQFCDFDKVVSNGVKEELARLSAARFIAPETEALVNVKQLNAFFDSPLFARLCKAKTVYREQRFNLFLPAAEFTKESDKASLLKDETVAVQGVIDLFFEEADGSIVLCDYKTDYLTREELQNPSIAADKLTARHGQQLSYYAKAIEAMLGRKPSEILIYSLPLGDSVKVSL